MSVTLQAVLGICAILLTLAQLLIRSGQWSGDTTSTMKAMQAELERLEVEIKTLREWRHEVGNFQSGMLAMNYAIERIDRLERKVFNGSAR